MNPKDHIPKPDLPLEALSTEAAGTVDDFIKELEAKEKDLHITSDMTIEVADSDFDPEAVPEFVKREIVNDQPGASEASRGGVGMKTRMFELENEVEMLQNRIKLIREERNEIQEKSDRRLKDFENYKYRMDRERRGAFIEQISTLAAQMLPVLDNLDRALASANGIPNKSAEFERFYDGIVLVNQQVNEVLVGMGVQPILSVGEMFDPNFHEAVATEEREDLPGNAVIDEMLKGYRIGNRVIRHSMVRVNSFPSKKSVFSEPIDDELDSVFPPDGDEPDDLSFNDSE
jgi:molecular chaperone GrpE